MTLTFPLISFADGNANFGDVEIHAISSLLKLFLVIYCLVIGVYIYICTTDFIIE